VNVKFQASFSRDVKKIEDKGTRKQIQAAVEQVEQAPTLQDITHLKKLEGYGNAYRIKVGEYRIGLWIENDVVIFIRCLPRKDIYRKFP